MNIKTPGKKLVFSLLLTCFVIMNVAIAEAGTVKLKYSDHDPPNGMRTGFVENVWLPEIQNQLGDKVKIQSFMGGSLMGSKEILKGIGDGIAQMGYVYPGHYPGQMVAHSIFKLFPRGPQKFEDIVWFYRTAYKEVPAFEAELKKANVKTLLFTAGLPGAFTGKNPLNSLDDISGDKWRAGDKWGLRFLENAGATPVSVPWGDVYMSLQTGAIDGCFTNYDGLHMMKFDEVAPNMLVSKALWYGIPFVHLVNRTTFEKLPQDVQDGILKATEIAEDKFAKVYADAFDQIKKEQEAAGIKVTVMSDDDISKWENAPQLAKLQATWVEEAEAAGLKNAAEVMAKVKEIHKRAMAR